MAFIHSVDKTESISISSHIFDQRTNYPWFYNFEIKIIWNSTSLRTTSMPDRIAESNANALRLCCHHRIMGWNPFWLDVFAKLHYNHKKFLQFFLLQHIMSKPRENNWCMELRRLLQKIFQPSVHTAWRCRHFETIN